MTKKNAIPTLLSYEQGHSAGKFKKGVLFLICFHFSEYLSKMLTFGKSIPILHL